MRGGRGAWWCLLAATLVALSLAGFASAPGTPAPAKAVLRLLPGPAGEAEAVRPASEASPATRSAPGARELGLLAVLLGSAVVIGLPATGAAPARSAAPAPAGRFRPATGRGPPHLPR